MAKCNPPPLRLQSALEEKDSEAASAARRLPDTQVGDATLAANTGESAHRLHKWPKSFSMPRPKPWLQASHSWVVVSDLLPRASGRACASSLNVTSGEISPQKPAAQAPRARTISFEDPDSQAARRRLICRGIVTIGPRQGPIAGEGAQTK